MAMRQMVFGLTLTAVGLAFSADVTWTGSGGVVDWSAATWSTETPPAATDTVKFKPSVHAPDFTVTPPADFTGKIMLLTYSSAASIGGNYFPGRIRIVNSNNAAFTVGAGGSDGGISVIEAFSGLEQMIDASYSQVVIVSVQCQCPGFLGLQFRAAALSTGVVEQVRPRRHTQGTAGGEKEGFVTHIGKTRSVPSEPVVIMPGST